VGDRTMFGWDGDDMNGVGNAAAAKYLLLPHASELEERGISRTGEGDRQTAGLKLITVAEGGASESVDGFGGGTEERDGLRGGSRLPRKSCRRASVFPS